MVDSTLPCYTTTPRAIKGRAIAKGVNIEYWTFCVLVEALMAVDEHLSLAERMQWLVSRK